MARKKFGVCVYCGERRKMTREHVVPQCLFPDPLPAVMITVGACHSCNNGKSSDDTYLRDFLVADLASGKSIAAQQIRADTFKRSVQTNRSEIARAFRKQAYRKPLVTPGGIYLGSPIAVPVDGKRLNLSFEKMVRGLYFHIWGERLPEDYTFEIARVDGFHTEEAWSEMRRLGANIAYISKDVFACQYAFVDKDHAVSRWLLLFYRTIIIEVLTLPPNGLESLVAEEEIDAASGLILLDPGSGNPGDAR